MAQVKNRGRTPEWIRGALTGGTGPFSLPGSSNWAAPAAKLGGADGRSKPAEAYRKMAVAHGRSMADAMRQEDRAESRDGIPFSHVRLTGETDMLREHAGKNWDLAKNLEGGMNKVLSGVKSAADKAADEFNAFNSGKSKLTPEQTIEMTNRMNELNKGFASTLYSASDSKVVHGGGNDVSSYDYQEQRGKIYQEYLDKAKGNLEASNAETERTQFEMSGKGMADEQMAAATPPSKSLAEIAQDTSAKAAAHASDLRMANERKNETENKALAGRIRDSHQSTDSFISDVKRDVNDAMAGKGSSPGANGPSITLSQEAAAAYQKNTGANPLSGNGMASAYVSSSGGTQSAFESSHKRKNGGMYADYDGGVTSDSVDRILSSYDGGDEFNRQYHLNERMGGFGMSEWLDVARKIADSEAPLSIRGTEMEDGWRDAEIRRSIPADVISAISERASSLGNNGYEDGWEQNSGVLAENGVSRATFGTDFGVEGEPAWVGNPNDAIRSRFDKSTGGHMYATPGYVDVSGMTADDVNAGNAGKVLDSVYVDRMNRANRDLGASPVNRGVKWAKDLIGGNGDYTDGMPGGVVLSTSEPRSGGRRSRAGRVERARDAVDAEAAYRAIGTNKPGAAELLRITDRVPMTPSTLATIVSDDEALDAAMTDGADGKRTLYLDEEERRRYDDIRKEFRKKNGRDMDDMTARLRAMRETRGDAEVKKLAIALRRRRDAALASTMGLDRDAPLADVTAGTESRDYRKALRKAGKAGAVKSAVNRITGDDDDASYAVDRVAKAAASVVDPGGDGSSSEAGRAARSWQKRTSARMELFRKRRDLRTGDDWARAGIDLDEVNNTRLLAILGSGSR